MATIPNVYCRLPNLSVEGRYDLETGIRRLVGLSPLSGPPATSAQSLLVVRNFPYLTSCTCAPDNSVTEVTISELKEIISNAKQ